MGNRRTRLGLAIVGAVLVACLAAAGLAVLLRTADPDGYGADVESEVVGFCIRSAPDVPTAPTVGGAAGDDVEDACRCAYQHLARTVPWSRFVAIDEQLRSPGDPPAELVDAVRACGAPN